MGETLRSQLILRGILWDDAGASTSSTSNHNGHLSLGCAASSAFQTRRLNSCPTTDKHSSTNHTFIDYHFLEYLELAQYMNDLGHPLFFVTSKSMKKTNARVLMNKRRNNKVTCLAHTINMIEKKEGLTGCSFGDLVKYWRKRYSLFSRFNDGIKMDEESLYSVTPEAIAKHHALQCGVGTIIDCFAGVGGNTIQFAMRGNYVIAIDVDPQKIDYAQHNADIYKVNERIDFRKGDFFKIAPSLKGDVVFLAPPWGGPDYIKMEFYDIRSLIPCDGHYRFKVASMIATKIIMFLPRNVYIAQLEELAKSVVPPWDIKIEKNYLNKKLIGITAYFDKGQ